MRHWGHWQTDCTKTLVIELYIFCEIKSNLKPVFCQYNHPKVTNQAGGNEILVRSSLTSKTF